MTDAPTTAAWPSHPDRAAAQGASATVRNPQLGVLVHAELAARGVEILVGSAVNSVSKAAPEAGGRLRVEAVTRAGEPVTRDADLMLPWGYAAGDCVVTYHRLLGETYLPLGTAAHKKGCVAGENACRRHRSVPASWKPRRRRLFDQAAARTGLRDHEAEAAGFDPVTIGAEADDDSGPPSRQPTASTCGSR